MRSTIEEQRGGGGLAPAGALVATSAPPTAVAAPAPAEPRPATTEHSTSRVDFSYAAPEIAATGDRLTWRWTVTNSGDLDALQVLVMHRLGAGVEILELSAGCAAAGAAVRCAYGPIAPGQKRSGSIVVALPDDAQGTLQISGRVIWRHAGRIRPAASRVPQVAR